MSVVVHRFTTLSGQDVLIAAGRSELLLNEDENPDYDWAPVHEEVQSLIERYS